MSVCVGVGRRPMSMVIILIACKIQEGLTQLRRPNAKASHAAIHVPVV